MPNVAIVFFAQCAKYLLEKVLETGKQCGNYAAKLFLAIDSPLAQNISTYVAFRKNILLKRILCSLMKLKQNL